MLGNIVERDPSQQPVQLKPDFCRLSRSHLTLVQYYFLLWTKMPWTKIFNCFAVAFALDKNALDKNIQLFCCGCARFALNQYLNSTMF